MRRVDAAARVENLAGGDQHRAAVALAGGHPVEDRAGAERDETGTVPVPEPGQLAGALGEPARHPRHVGALALGAELEQHPVDDARRLWAVGAGALAELAQEERGGCSCACRAGYLHLHRRSGPHLSENVHESAAC